MLSRRPLTRLLSEERGQSLVLALLVMTILAISLGMVMFFTAGNQRNANYQKQAQIATSLAEAGVNNAVSVLSNPANANSLILYYKPADDTGTSVLPDNRSIGGVIAHPANSTTYGNGTVKWWGRFCDSVQTTSADCGAGSIPDWTWTLHAQATVPNPSGAPGSTIVKTMSAQVQVHQPNPGQIKVGVWNTIFSPGSLCGSASWGQGVNLSVPLYVGGDLCIGQSAQLNAPIYVGGNVSISNKQAAIGCSKLNGNGCQTPAPITGAHVGGYCAGPSGTQVGPPCKSEPWTPDTNIWVQNPTAWNPAGIPSQFIDQDTGQLITAPTICWAASSGCAGDLAGGWYNVASPGPRHPCTTSSVVGTGTTTPPVFDNLVGSETSSAWGPDEGYPNGSVPGSFNLTPDGLSYTCQTAQGELSWNATSRTLRVDGTIFIDGSVYAKSSNSAPITYTGSASHTCTTTLPCDGVIYVSGTVYITSVKICAVVNANNTDCDWTTGDWDPNTKLLVFLAHSQGTQTGVSAGQGIVVGPTQTSFQGGLYANYQINTGQGAATQGPLVSGTQTVVVGQQFEGSFPNITILPISLKGPPQAFWIDPPKNFTYGG